MNQIQKRFFAAICTVTVVSTMAVSASAASGREHRASNAGAYCSVHNTVHRSRNDCKLEGMLSSIFNKIDWDKLPVQKPVFPGKPGWPECPDIPETPDIPDEPELPQPPDIPIIPDVPEIPDKPETPEDGSLSAYTQRVVDLVNEERTKAGLKPLIVSDSVQTAAQVRAREQEKKFSHTRPNGSNFDTVLTEAGVSYRGAGENVAYGQRSPEAVMNGWMNSSGHRANIMNANYKYIGVGFHEGSSGNYYWAQLFTY